MIRGLALVVIVLGTACGSPHRAAPTATSEGKPALSHGVHTIFLVVMENHNWSDIQGNPSAPYINRKLLPHASYARRYYNPPGIHPSLPNYLWLQSGSNLGVSRDCDPGVCGQLKALHLTDLLDRAGISWRAYEESAPSACPTSNRYPYAAKHDPFVYFADVATRRRYCRRHIVPFSRFRHDLVQGRVARYNFITPNLCHDMHDACPPLDDSVMQGDRWLGHVVPRITRSRAYKAGGVLFITWDEGEGGDGPIGLIVMSRLGRGNGYTSHTVYDSSSTLRTVEELLGVRPMLGQAAHVPDLRALFSRFP